MQWALIDRVGHLAFYFLTKISGINKSSVVQQDIKHFSTIKVVEATIDSPPVNAEGWSVDGWREDEEAAAHTIEPLGTVSMADSKTIYAVYKRDASFHSGVNKATKNTVTQYYNTVNKFSVLTPSAASAKPITGFTAKSWVTDGGTAVTFGSMYTGSASIFYAKYQRTANFYHGVNKASNTGATQDYTSDNVYKISTPAISKATDIGNSWKAEDWLQKDDNEHVAGAITYDGPRNVFYAYYKRNITINYTANGGTGAIDATTGEQAYDSSNAINPSGLVLSENAFVRTGYRFTGWDVGASGEILDFAVTDPSTKTASAQWAGFTYTVKYAAGTATGGWSAASYPDQSATYPENITLHTNNMTKNNTEKANTKYRVTFNANGGSVSPGTADSYIPIAYTKNGWTTTSGSTTREYTNGQTYNRTDADNTAITLYPCFTQTDQARTAITPPTPSKTNMSCTGWWTATSGGSKVFSCGAKYTNVTKNQTVYAQWTNATKKLGSTSKNYVVMANSHTTGSDRHSIYAKNVFKVVLELLAGKTWQNMADDDTYKWPTYLYYSYASVEDSSSPGNPRSGTYTSRAAVKAADLSRMYYPYLVIDRVENNVYAPAFHPRSTYTRDFYVVSSPYTGVIGTTNKTTTVEYGAYDKKVAYPSNPSKASDIIQANSTYYILSGSNTALNTNAAVKDPGSVTMVAL